MQGWHEDRYFKKRIPYSLQRRQFSFDAAELLFSTHEIDLGSQLLLRRLVDQLGTPRSILDLGCGYGVIGIVLAAFVPQAEVVLVDKDLLATHYAAHNAELNQQPHVRVVPSIGIDDLPPQQFDLIVSNIPAHIGELAIERDFLLQPLTRLNPGGVYWFVVVSSLIPLVLKTAQRYQLDLAEIALRPGHTVFTLQAPPA